MVIVQSPSLTVDDPAFREKVESVFAQIAALGPGTVQLGQHYYSTDGPVLVPPDFLVSADGRATAILFFLAGDLEEATENVEDVIHVVEEADAADDFRVLIGGDASVAFENNELSARDLEQGERFGIPVALIILLTRSAQSWPPSCRLGWPSSPSPWRWRPSGSSAKSPNCSSS